MSIVKRLGRLIITVAAIVLFYSSISPVLAQSLTASMVLSPATSTSTRVGDSFVVTVQLQSSASLDINYARSVFTFDPARLEIVTVENGTLFCKYPTDAANFLKDNTNGKLMITGVSSGTTGCTYPKLTTTPVVFAKITIKAKKTGPAVLSFGYTGALSDTQSGITKAGSPPTFVMGAPTNGTYTIQEAGVPTASHTVIDTGIEDYGMVIYLGGLLYALGILGLLSERFIVKKGTVEHKGARS